MRLMILYLETTTPKTVEKSRNKYSLRCNLEPVFLSVATSYLLRRLLIYLQLVCLLNSASVTLIAQFYPRTILVASRKLHSYAAYISRFLHTTISSMGERSRLSFGHMRCFRICDCEIVMNTRKERLNVMVIIWCCYLYWNEERSSKGE